MEVEFDAAKGEANIAKHGVSLARAADLDILAVERDDRRAYGEVRYRVWGLLDGQPHSLAFALRNERVRAISLRRASSKEVERYVQP